MILIPVACFLVTLVVMAGINHLEMRPWVHSVGLHWAERSRILWPARRSNSLLLLYLPLVVTAASKLVVDSTMLGLAPRLAAAFLGAIGANWFIVQKLFPNVRFRFWLNHLCLSGMTRVGYWSIFIAAIVVMPNEFNLNTAITFLAAGTLMIAWQFIALFLLRLIGFLKPAGERLQQIVESCTDENSPKINHVWEAPSITANALAFPYNGSLIFFEPLLKNLTDEEVAAVCSHEIGHLAESVPVMIARLLGSINVLPLVLIQPTIQALELPGFLLLLLLMILWGRLAIKLSHHMEIKADKAATSHQSSDGTYARALEKIHQINHIPALLHTNRSTHPNLYDRMIAAGYQPDFPPPWKPNRFTTIGWIAAFGGPLSLVIFATYLFP